MSRRNRSLSRSHARVRSQGGPVGRAGEAEAEVAHRPHERVVLEQGSVLLQGLLEVVGPVRRSEAAPGDEVRAGCDGRGRVDLQQGQPLHDVEQRRGPGCIEQLGAHRDASSLRLGEPMRRDAHGSHSRLAAGDEQRRSMTEEATLKETPAGLEPAGEGWFVVNVRDTKWMTHHAFGAGCVFESRENAHFPELGINISVVQPGEPLCLYHEESAQEDFLVLAGEAVLLVNGEERPLQAWDFFHCPAGTEHVIVGAGDGPAIVLAVGARHETETLRYPKSELAAKYDASAEEDTPNPGEAYARFERPQPGRPDYWDELPWA
jgi:uncharacterized cupin superfamily protein